MQPPSRRRLAVALAVVAVLGAAAVAVGTQWDRLTGTSGPRQQLAVPAYIDPESGRASWDRLLAAGSTDAGSLGIIVVNVASGPALARDPIWGERIAQAHAAGTRVLGYVDTGYLGSTGAQTRSGGQDAAAWTSQAEADAASWFTQHGADGLDGIFLDRVPDACGPEPSSSTWAAAYLRLTSRIDTTHPGAYTVANPGAPVPQCFEFAADTLVTFEGGYDTYVSSYQPLSWTPDGPAKTWHLVYGVPSASGLRIVMDLSGARRAGFVYATPDAPANPWDSLPPQPFWSTEQDMLSDLGP
jgi:hypothetical protein